MPRSPEFPRPHILAHRMMVMGYPENTILSLQQAIALGVDWMRMIKAGVDVIQTDYPEALQEFLADHPDL